MAFRSSSRAKRVDLSTLLARYDSCAGHHKAIALSGKGHSEARAVFQLDKKKASHELPVQGVGRKPTPIAVQGL